MYLNRTPTLVYLDSGMHPGMEVKGLNRVYHHIFHEIVYLVHWLPAYKNSLWR